MSTISIYDTTLRDGTQAEDISLSTEDKIRITRTLDQLGVQYIEGGWPLSNATDRQYFQEIRNYELKHSLISAFGSTHNPKQAAENDQNLASVLEVDTPVVTLFGKTWDVHVREALRTTNEHNLQIIHDSLAFVRPHVRELFFDAEHFFDGFKGDPDFALACLGRAAEAGADVLVLCDTNGGTMPHEVADIVARVRVALPEARLGIHAHNDSETAVASSIEAVRAGCTQVQGTINGFGERCGNANLCSIIPNLELKLNLRCLPEGSLRLLRSASLYVSETANIQPFHRQPYVGRSAFAHKGGIHVSAVTKNPKTYEHIDPSAVGNKQRILLSDLSGRSNILFKARQYGFELDRDDPFVMELLAELKKRENLGYEYASAEASFELILNKTLGRARKYFEITSFRVLDLFPAPGGGPCSEATVVVRVGGHTEHTAASGRGPVNALDNALRKALEGIYPNLKEMSLKDFKVRVLPAVADANGGTASNVRVLIESGDARSNWITVGLSHNIIEASKEALEDSFNYKLFSDDREKLTRALKNA